MSVTGSSDPPSNLDVQNLRMTNASHSKTRSLPYETLSYIFQLACPALDVFMDSVFGRFPTPKFHLVLRLVSSLWYQVVQSTPQLWTSFRLFDTAAEQMKDYIKLALDNSAQSNLHIIFSTGSRNVAYGEWVKEILELVLHRIESLRVLVPTPTWFDTVLPKMTRLRAIYLPEAQTVPGATTLERMRLEYSRFSPIDIPPMTSITHLHLHYVQIDFSLQFLTKCPNLVDFSSHHHTGPRGGAKRLTSTLVLEKLSSFSWSTPISTDSQFHDTLFEHLHLPALERFCLENYHRLEFNTHTVAFFSRLPKSLRELEFRHMDHQVRKGLLRCLDKYIGISTIRVHCCSPLFLKDILSCLSETTDEGTFRLPHLTSIHLRFVEAPSSLLAPDPPLKLWLGRKLALILQERVGLIDGFTFTVDSSRWLDWNDKIWRVLKELKQGGFGLTLVGYTRVIDIEEMYVKSVRKWSTGPK